MKAPLTSRRVPTSRDFRDAGMLQESGVSRFSRRRHVAGCTMSRGFRDMEMVLPPATKLNAESFFHLCNPPSAIHGSPCSMCPLRPEDLLINRELSPLQSTCRISPTWTLPASPPCSSHSSKRGCPMSRGFRDMGIRCRPPSSIKYRRTSIYCCAGTPASISPPSAIPNPS